MANEIIIAKISNLFRTPSQFVCEFQGGANLVQTPGSMIKAQSPDDPDKHPVKYLFDNIWPTEKDDGN